MLQHLTVFFFAYFCYHSLIIISPFLVHYIQTHFTSLCFIRRNPRNAHSVYLHWWVTVFVEALSEHRDNWRNYSGVRQSQAFRTPFRPCVSDSVLDKVSIHFREIGSRKYIRDKKRRTARNTSARVLAIAKTRSLSACVSIRYLGDRISFLLRAMLTDSGQKYRRIRGAFWWFLSPIAIYEIERKIRTKRM